MPSVRPLQHEAPQVAAGAADAGEEHLLHGEDHQRRAHGSCSAGARLAPPDAPSTAAVVVTLVFPRRTHSAAT